MGINRAAGVVLSIGLMAGACTSASGSEPTVEPVTTSTGAHREATGEASTTSTLATEVTTTIPEPAGRDVMIRERTDDLGEQQATIYESDRTVSSSAVVVLLHGFGGNRGDYTHLARAIADLGVDVINADWLASPSHAAESASDAVCAVAFAQEYVRSNGSDQPKTILVGHSGGSHVGILAALAPERFSEWCDTASDAHVWAYVGLAGDPATATPGGNMYASWKDDPELLALMDGYTHLGGNPGLIVRFLHGTDDDAVPPERTRRFHDAMVEAGYESEFTQIDGVGHFGVARPSNEAAGAKVLAAIADLIAQAP